MSDAAVTKWELPDLFSQNSGLRKSKVSSTDANSRAGEQDEQAERQSGFEQGRQEGLSSGQAEISEKLDVLDGIIGSLSAPLAQTDNQIARELIQLSVRLAETIIHREVDLQPELIEKQVAEALATLSSQSSEIIIRLHPDDAKILEQGRAPGSGSDSAADAITENTAENLFNSSSYQITPDPSLHRGGCILHTPTTLVDATIEKQLQDLLSEMLDTAAQQ